MIDKPSLDCKYPVGNGVETPEYQNGPSVLIDSIAPSMEGENVSTTASSENRSAKWKNGAQDVPAAGRSQYE